MSTDPAETKPGASPGSPEAIAAAVASFPKAPPGEALPPATPPATQAPAQPQPPSASPEATPPQQPRPLSGFGKWGLGVAGLVAVLSIGLAFALCLIIILGAGGDKLSGTYGPLYIRLLISCVTIFIAMGFCGVGFGLFVIGAEGSFKVQSQPSPQASQPPATSLRGLFPAGLETTAPGLVVIVCATAIIFAALNIEWEQGRGGGVGPAAVAAAGAAVKKEALGGIKQPPNEDNPTAPVQPAASPSASSNKPDGGT